MQTLAERRARHAAYMREYRKTHPEKRTVEGLARRYRSQTVRRRLRKATEPEYARREHLRGLLGRTPEAHRAQERVLRAVRSGRLHRPTICGQCAGGGPIEAAHEDYARPLDVRWLCRSCHRRWDQAGKGGYVPPGQAALSHALGCRP